MVGSKVESMASRLAGIYSKDRWGGAKNIGNLVASIKRTVSAMRAIIDRKYVSGTEVTDLLSDEDRAVLNKAAAILSTLAGQAESAKRQVKRAEAEYKDRYARASREAKIEVAKVLQSASVEDIVVSILWRASYRANNLQTALSEAGSPGKWPMSRNLQYYLENARDELAHEVAADAASKNLPLSDILSPLVTRLQEHRPKILEREAVLIARIKNRCEQEVAGTTETQ